MEKRKIILILIVCSFLLSSCNNKVQNTDKIASEETLKNLIEVKNSNDELNLFYIGEAVEQELDVEKAINLLFSDKKVIKEENIEGKDQHLREFKQKVLIGENDAWLMISSKRINYHTGQAEFVVRSFRYQLSAEDEDYNVNNFEVDKDLNFMKREEAIEKALQYITQIGLIIGEHDVVCSALDYMTLENEYRPDRDHDGNILEYYANKKWTADDDCYLIQFSQKFKRVPIFYYNEYFKNLFNFMQDRYQIECLVSKNGIESLKTNNEIYSFIKETEEKVVILDLDNIKKIIEQQYSQNLLNLEYEIKDEAFFYKVHMKNKNNFEMRPTWQFKIFEKSNDGENRIVYQNYDAITGEML